MTGNADQPSTVSREIGSVAALHALKGSGFHFDDWLLVDQPMIDAFAEITGDRQWIHIDPVRAAESPFGGTIAHGLLILSLTPRAFTSVFSFPGRKLSVNYGYHELRFTAPVRACSRVRTGFGLVGLEDVAGGQVRCDFSVKVEVDGSEQPALVASWLVQMAY